MDRSVENLSIMDLFFSAAFLWEVLFSFHQFVSVIISTFSLFSGLWLCQVPSEQHDGGNTLWVPYVHGKQHSL